ncbi:MAG: formate--tetrahydrofolate ligase [Alphaproteobacteria bacterium]|nr:formate--tetrahydrofolate ligase [Alphaproteobacteria bacterium]
MLSDIEISNQAKPFKINQIAKALNLKEEDLEPYGKYKAKLTREITNELTTSDKKGKLILVTALTPTPAGEGKSTVSIGLADAFHKLNYKTCLSLREPSLGPCFGIKGGATGGGYSQVIPMEDINLNFTGDIHAITSANNLLSALIDNHIKHGNQLDIQKVYFKRCVDLNDRALREITIALGSPINGTPRQDGFNISVASEIMAILCLSENITDLKKRIDNIVIAENSKQEPIYAKDIKASGAMTAILKDAILPNLVQTLEHTPAFIHGGPFANIAHGTSSIIAARSALALADYVVTEAGFGADLGAEKFFNIFARHSNLYPDAVVLVATARALKMHGGVSKENLNQENLEAIKEGFANLKAHITNIKKFGYNPIVAINKFSKDTTKELQLVKDLCQELNVIAVISEGWEKGGNGCIDLANTVINQITNKQNIFSPLHLLYPGIASLKDKIQTIAKEIYNAKDVTFTEQALKDLEKFTQWGYYKLPVCIAKTQNSISHDKKLLGAPSDYTFPITEVRLSAGAGFVVALSGEINTMPGLPKVPAAENIDVDENGIISGLF